MVKEEGHTACQVAEARVLVREREDVIAALAVAQNQDHDLAHAHTHAHDQAMGTSHHKDTIQDREDPVLLSILRGLFLLVPNVPNIPNVMEVINLTMLHQQLQYLHLLPTRLHHLFGLHQ